MDNEMIDREKVIEALELCINQHKNCNDCPYHNEMFCADVLMFEALELLKNQNKMLE